jgi:putative addiction module antidote
MVKVVTIRQTGTSISATIPKEMSERFHFGVGDQVFAVEREDGVLFTPYDPKIERAMQAYDRIAKRDREGLRGLAKK